ncbi:MAG TPA: glycosyltransferase [Baekduia sp.]|uniref:glycosyltransferase family 2 protein n=1 Tax=Baekduia sp. TaxID=2600305 RepID=UPI002B55C19A|nr:glycosyltransferase [Baekduia sp.]HMJ33988.1 glycosyltransferase [Baekduia sp.]
MPTAPAVSVVVATHNRADRLQTLLDALAAQTLAVKRFEVVVVDDGSRDETPDVLRRAEAREDLRVRVLTQPQAGGPAAARNRGWRAAEAPVIAFTDDDCRPTPRWLQTLLTAATAREDQVVQGRTEPDPLECEALGPFAKTLRIDGMTPHFETCNIAYPRAILETVGGFNEQYPRYGEDSDLGWRVKDTGATVVFAHDAIVYHAVFPIGRAGTLKAALIATHDVRCYKENLGLRQWLVGGVFYKRSHALMLEAALGLWLARRAPAAALFAFPYLSNVASRTRMRHGARRDIPFFVLWDAVELAATVRGAVRHRLPVI